MFETFNPINIYSIKNKNKNQILFLFSSFTKDQWLLELTNIDSTIYLLVKEEVEELFYKLGGYLTYLDFDSCYQLAVEITKNQINKSIKENKKCFFEVKNNDNLLVYKKVKERLVNNIKNLFDYKRKINVSNFEILLMDEIYENYEIDFTIRDLQKLIIIKPELVIDNIIKLANNFELTIIEIEELGEKLDIDFSNIVNLDLNLQFKNLKKAVNNQIYFDFEEIMVA